MPELPRSLLLQLRLMALLWVGALSLYALPTRARAQTAPANLRACTAEPDPSRRLACYDKAMGRTSPAAARPQARPTPTAPDRASSSMSPAAERAPGSTPTQVPHPVSPSAPPPQVAGSEPPAPHRMSSWKKIFAGGGSWQVTAHVARLERSPAAMVLHLDNGQVWQEVGPATGDLSLHTGDSVTIERHLGSYWLKSRYISNMQVRQQPQ